MLSSLCVLPHLQKHLPHVACLPTVTAVSAAALRGWTLLLTVMPELALTDVWREEQLDSLSRQLSRSEVDVRAAAGCAAALLLEGWGMAEPEPDSETDTGWHPIPMLLQAWQVLRPVPLGCGCLTMPSALCLLPCVLYMDAGFSAVLTCREQSLEQLHDPCQLRASAADCAPCLVLASFMS